ncbi:ABC-2 family transporter protein [Candidatus Peregrinibacteria bacterium]|nr:ABC-2 family transporter protein [Candidatus Peregrinibacteria bacterium]
MRKYLSILRLGWLDAIAYRTEFFVSILSWGIRLFIAIFLWLAVTESRGGTIGAYNFQSMLVYLFLVQIISSFIFSRVGFDIAHDIYRGNFANFLLKPVNYLFFRLVHEMSKNLFRTIIGIAIFGSLLFFVSGGIQVTFGKLFFGVIAMIGAYLINFGAVAILALSAFWVTSSTRFMFIYFGILTIFSGMIFPVDLFPEKILRIFLWLPFPYVFYFPAKIFQSPELTGSLLKGFFHQWGSVIILLAFVWFIYRRGVKKFEAIGR